MTTEVKEKRVVKFKGKALYAQVYPGQERPPHPDELKKKPTAKDDRHYAIKVECSEELFKKLQKAGLNKLHQIYENEEDGKTYINIKGTHTKTYIDKTTREQVTARFKDPEVTDAEGNPFTDLIGNGSVVEVTAEFADGARGKSLRLNKVKVLEHVEFIKPEVVEDVLFSEDEDNTATKTTAATQNIF